MPYVRVTFVQETFDLVTFVHMSNASAATDQIFKLHIEELHTALDIFCFAVFLVLEVDELFIV